MTEKKMEFIEDLAEAYWIDMEDEWDTRAERCANVLESNAFTSWCYINHERLCLQKVVEIAEQMWLLDDNDY